MIDIDLVCPQEAIDGVKAAARDLGYKAETTLSDLANGKLTIACLTKFDSESEDYLMLDLLHGSPSIQQWWEQRNLVNTEFGELWVVSREGLKQLKGLRGNRQDEADIERLGASEDGS